METLAAIRVQARDPYPNTYVRSVEIGPQGSTTACTAVKDAKGSSRGLSGKTLHTRVGTARIAWLTSDSAIAASTAAIRSVWQWE